MAAMVTHRHLEHHLSRNAATTCRHLAVPGRRTSPLLRASAPRILSSAMRVSTRNVLRTKCVLVGDPAVGKTSLLHMFLSDGRTFNKNYNMTCGVELSTRSVSIPDTDDAVELFLYDCSGRDLYLDSLPKYWQEPNILLAVFDVSSQSSLESVAKWVSLVRSCIPVCAASSSPAVLFGNKTDLQERRAVNPKAGAAVAERLGLHYFEGSAKENIGVEDPFFLLAYEWHKLLTEKRTSFDLIT